MTPRAEQLLRLLQHAPRTIKSLTGGDFSAHPEAITGWLERLMEAGYVQQEGVRPNYRYGITTLGESYLANRPAVAASRVHCNAAMRAAYVPAEWVSPRAGADDHRRYGSAGRAC